MSLMTVTTKATHVVMPSAVRVLMHGLSQDNGPTSRQHALLDALQDDPVLLYQLAVSAGWAFYSASAETGQTVDRLLDYHGVDTAYCGGHA